MVGMTTGLGAGTAAMEGQYAGDDGRDLHHYGGGGDDDDGADGITIAKWC